jgi:hypothetical protein
MTTPERRADDRAATPSTSTAPPDPGSVIDDLRRRLRAEQERTLNATDAMRGAWAEAAQARAEIRELQHCLHVRESELRALGGLVAADDPLDTGTTPGSGGTSPSPAPVAGSEATELPTPMQALRILARSVAHHLGRR